MLGNEVNCRLITFVWLSVHMFLVLFFTLCSFLSSKKYSRKRLKLMLKLMQNKVAVDAVASPSSDLMLCMVIKLYHDGGL